MTSEHIMNLVDSQKRFYKSGKSKDITYRIKVLQLLKQTLKKYDTQLMNAMREDMYRPDIEMYMSNIHPMYISINSAIKNIRKIAKPQKVKTPHMLMGAKSYIRYEPLGLVLIQSTWNYPIQLSLGPLIEAVAAGNCVLLKPSELSGKTAVILEKIVEETFERGHCDVINGGVEVSTELLKQRFDLIHFTGSTRIGKIVAKAAAANLSRTILELGGKNPTIVDADIAIQTAANRIIWTKFFNAGQTCVTTDYILVHDSIKDQFTQALFKAIDRFYGKDPLNSKDLCQLINENHFNRIESILEDSKVIYGGKTDRSNLKIEPTIVEVESWDEKSMQEEIFGPILPIMTYSDIDDVIETLSAKEKPLALYPFSNNRNWVNKVLDNLSSGGVTVNGAFVQLMNHDLPFGGVGMSGMGSYHGIAGIKNFSHERSILKQSFRFDMSFAYPPYNSDKLLKIFRKLV